MTKAIPALAAALAGLLLAVSAPAPPAAAQASEQQQYQQRLRRLLQQLDSNGDGRLDRREASRNPYLERHFDRLDQGGKGYLLPSDLR